MDIHKYHWVLYIPWSELPKQRRPEINMPFQWLVSAVNNSQNRKITWLVKNSASFTAEYNKEQHIQWNFIFTLNQKTILTFPRRASLGNSQKKKKINNDELDLSSHLIKIQKYQNNISYLLLSIFFYYNSNCSLWQLIHPSRNMCFNSSRIVNFVKSVKLLNSEVQVLQRRLPFQDLQFWQVFQVCQAFKFKKFKSCKHELFKFKKFKSFWKDLLSLKATRQNFMFINRIRFVNSVKLFNSIDFINMEKPF